MIRSYVAFAAALLLMTGCGGDGTERASRPGAGGKLYGGTYRLNILRGDPKALDPVKINSKHGDDIASQIYDRLVDLDDSLRLVPELARELPTISEDGLVYTFRLRTDVRFHDDDAFPGGKGRGVTAEDVRYSLTRCCDPRTGTVAFWAFQDKVVGATEYFNAINERRNAGGDSVAVDSSLRVEGFVVLDDSTFQVRLLRPYAPFIYVFVNALGDIVPREAVEKYGNDFQHHPVGSGPFVFAGWKPDQEIVLRRNPNYWGRDEHGNPLPFLDEIQFRFIKDDKLQLNEFLGGSLEESFNVPTERFAEIFDVETRKPRKEFEKYIVQATPAMLTWFFDFNTQLAPFDNAEVRRAFNLAVDRERIVRFALQNSPYAPAHHGLVPPVFPGYPVSSINGYRFDPVKAKEALARAGYPEAKGFPPVTLTIYPEPRLQHVAQAVQEMLNRSLNIQVELKIIDFPQLLDQAELGKLQFWGTRWYGDYPDPETFLQLLNGEHVPTDPTLKSYPNSTRYNNPRYNELFRKGASTIDQQAQMKYYAEAEQIAVGDAPLIPLFYDMHYRLLQPGVRDNPLDPMARYDLKKVWFDRKR